MTLWDPKNILSNKLSIEERSKEHVPDNRALGTNDRLYDISSLKYIYNKLKESNVPYIKNMSILTNIAEESGGNPFAKHGESFGLLQWSPERYNKLSDDFYIELNNQLQYIIESSKNENDKVSWTHGGENSGYKSYKNALDDFNSKDINKSIKGLTLGYVRPKGKHDSVNNRINAFNILKEMFDEYKSGGALFAKSGIHIKPENRGKFTALKKRTGKSSTWYKEHGTPAQRKMATFALNAKKWHHGNN